MIRLQLLPTSFLTMLTGKLVAYGAVCMAQFALMMLVGRFIMPLFGAEPLTLAQAYGGLGVVLFCVALAATAFEPSDLERTEERLFALRALARKHRVQVDDLPALARIGRAAVGAGGRLGIADRLQD